VRPQRGITRIRLPLQNQLIFYKGAALDDIWKLCQDKALRENPKAYYTDAEAARILGAPKLRIFKMRHAGMIKETRFTARRVYIHRTEIERLLRGDLCPENDFEREK
jgi:hypothetical protein